MKPLILVAALLVSACGGTLPEIRSHAMPASPAVPPFERAYNEGKRHLLANRVGLAIVMFERAAAIDSRSVAALNAIGTAYDLLHRPELARSYYTTALAIEPRSADTINNMAVSASLSGDTRLASELFAQAAMLDPGNATIRRNLQAGGQRQLASSLTEPGAAFAVHRPQIVRSGLSEFTLVLNSGDLATVWPGTGAAFSPFGLQCVPFARDTSGIMLRGDAAYWWRAASGIYARGSAPEVGSIMSFRPLPIMPLGHVAVVTRIMGPREIRIDHANWTRPGDPPAGISRNVAVIDVSERNDWSAVRVETQYAGVFGSIYSINGFIYNRPDGPNPPGIPPRVIEVMNHTDGHP